MLWNDPLFSKQWHLHNKEIPTHDINVLPVWKKGIFGNGTTIALLDYGIDYKHDDLRNRYCPEGSFDVNLNRADVEINNEERHATRCAGEIVAEGNNGASPLIGIFSDKSRGSICLDI